MNVSRPATTTTLHALLASEKALPVIPRAVALLLSELDKEEPDLRKINQSLGTDPVLTARVLQLANSASFLRVQHISGLPQALAVLGLRQLRGLVVNASMGSAFKAVPGMHLQQFWRYSLDTAKLASTLAGFVKQDPVEAFTAGLIHAVGELVMCQGMAQELAPLESKVPFMDIKRARVESHTFGFCYAEVGAGFARAWQFPATIVEALEHQCAPFENGDYAPLAGLLHLASWRARAREGDFDDGRLAVTYPDTVGLALGIDIDMVLHRDAIVWTLPQEAGVFV